jgi:hypothetical protein
VYVDVAGGNEGRKGGVAKVSAALLSACSSRSKVIRASPVMSVTWESSSPRDRLCGVTWFESGNEAECLLCMTVAPLQTFAKSDASSVTVAVAGLFKNDSMVLNPRTSGVRSPWSDVLDVSLGHEWYKDTDPFVLRHIQRPR